MPVILGDPEALAAEVIRRAHHRAVETEEEARRRASAIVEGARQESESLRKQSGQAAERQVAALIRRNEARAELEAQRRFIQLREGPMTSVWREAEKRLRELVQRPDYRGVLKLCAFHAARELGASDLALAADPRGHELLSQDTLEQWSKEAGARFQRAPEPAPIWGGLIATAGRARFDASFPTQLALARETLRERIFQILSESKA